MNVIAILVYNQPELTQSMYNQLGDELIVFDNGSLVDQPNLNCTIIKWPTNHFFSGGWNIAMTYINNWNTKWVWMLNSDLLGIYPHMMVQLISEAERLNLAVISPSFNSPHRHMQNQGQGTRKVKWIDWCCPIVNMDVWKDVGEFDDVFLGYGADLDWCKRASLKGYEFGVSDDYELHHIGSVTAISEGLMNIQGDVGHMNKELKRKWNVSDWSRMFEES